MPVEQLIFTDRPAGKGVDPGAAGYQIKACSAGLGLEARQQLANICMHHGQAFSPSYAPRAAIEQEQDWRTQTSDRKVVPDEVLDEFPVIWSYDRLADDLFALTRVRYTCLTHDGRTGNFFAHALVFDPNDLAPHDYNPLALSHSELFRSSDPGDDTTLPALPDLGDSAGGDQPRYELFRAAPYRDHLVAMVAALCAATPSTRPVLLCLADWRQAAPLVEVLLSLLPPSARCRTTVSTYESDRTWVIPTKAGRPAGLAAAHHLLVLCDADGRSFNLRPDEYRSVYAVFNFVGHRSSELEAPRRFAAFAAACVLDERMERLREHHTFVERLGFEQDLNAWDTLVPAVDLPAGQLPLEALTEAAHSVTTLATRSDQAEIALGLLLPHVQSLTEANDSPGLTALTTDLAALTDRLPEASLDDSQGFISAVQDLANKALSNGQVHTAMALLKTCGRARDRLLLTLLNHVLDEPPSPSTAADQEQLVELLLDGLRLAEETPDVAPPFARLLVATFRAASEANIVADVWARIGDPLVKTRLDGEGDEEKVTLARELVEWVSADGCPEGNAWLKLKLLETTKLKGKKLRDILTETAYAGSRCVDAADLTTDILRIARERSPEKEQLAIALGRMTEAAHNTASEETFFAAYQDTMEQTNPKHRKQIYRRLAEADVVHPLCRELLGEVLPWDEDSPKKFQRWRNVVLNSYAQVLDGLRQHVADLIRESGQAESFFPLVETLVPKQQSKSTPEPGLIALYSSVTLTLPLEPLSDRWSQTFATLLDSLTPEAATRLRVVKFMRKIEQHASKPNWSVIEFPDTDPAWRDDVRSLHPPQKAKVLERCIDTLTTSGVTTPKDAQRLVELLDRVGEPSPDYVANAINQLLRGRDPVTCVLAVTAFARCALEGPKPDERWGRIVGATLMRFDRNTRRLFEAHLAHRFCRRDQKYEARLDQLCLAAGLPRPKPTVSPEQAADTIKDSSPTSARQPISGLLGSARRHLRRFVGEKDAAEKSSGRREKRGRRKSRRD